jgi:hypothetical protein
MSEIIINQNTIEILPTPPILIEVNNNPIAIRGMSAYEVAVNEGFTGSEEEWLDTLKASTVQWNSTNW